MDICIDFDGSCVTHEYPEIGNDIGAVPVLKALVGNGHNLILNTMRGNGQTQNNKVNYYLNDAIKWFKDNDLPLYGVNKNPNQNIWTNSPKCYGDLYIDDAALGAPLKFDKSLSDRPFLNWEIIKEYLIQRKIIIEY